MFSTGEPKRGEAALDNISALKLHAIKENRVPARRKSMRKTKELLRLRFELGFGQRQIARSCGMGVGTVHLYLERAAAAGIGWPLPEGLSEEELEAKLFGNQPVRARAVRGRPQPDWKTIHEQLQQHRHLTLQLVWEEYGQAHPEGYRYSWFCERYRPARSCVWQFNRGPAASHVRVDAVVRARD